MLRLAAVNSDYKRQPERWQLVNVPSAGSLRLR